MSLSRTALRFAALEALRPTVALAPVRSSSSVALPLGRATLAFDVADGLGFWPGLPVTAAADGSHYVAGKVLRYFSSGAGWVLSIDVVTVAGSGTFDDWSIGSPFPTLAKSYVFDSRLDPVEDLQVDEQRPVAVVYTEEDNGDPGQTAGGPPFKRTVDLIVELSVVAKGPVPELQDDGTVTWVTAEGTAFTDAKLEGWLDRLEYETRLAMFRGPTGKLFRDLTGSRVTDIRSLPHRSSEESARLAQRTVRMQVTVPDDFSDAAPATPAVGTAMLPQPLRDVVDQLASTAYGAALAAFLAADVPIAPIATPLKTVTLGIDAAPADGVAEIEASADHLDN